MSADALAKAARALLTGVTVYEEQVPGAPSYPYVFLKTDFPSASQRAVNRGVQAREVRVRATVVGLSPAAVRIISEKVNVLEGARLVVAGWNVGRMEAVPNGQGMMVDRDVTLPNSNAHPLYAVLDWTATASRV